MYDEKQFGQFRGLCGENSANIAIELSNKIYNWRVGSEELRIRGHNMIEFNSGCPNAYDVTGKTIDQIIYDLRLFNVFVFSLPRSGSSMMTHILELLGVNMIYTSEDKEKRDKMNKRYEKRLGEYHPNKAGFFEITDNMLQNYINILSRPYSGCKMIIPVRRHRMEVVKMNPCKVIQMWRDPEEIRQSQEAFYSKRSDSDWIRTALVQEKIKLEKAIGADNYLGVEYQDVLNDPRAKIEEISKFINAPNKIDDAVDSVNPSVNRFKKEDLEQGI